MKKYFILVLYLLSVFEKSFASINVISTTQDLKYLIEYVGKNFVHVESLSKGTQDPHYLEAKPSFMIKLRDADLLIYHGLELEAAWLDQLIDGSRNQKIRSHNLGNLELGKLLDPIEVPKGELSRADGDVHPQGNPHFHLDPVRLIKASGIIAQRLSEIDVKNKDFYYNNAKSFSDEVNSKIKEWTQRIKSVGTTEIITYHKTFSYFLDRFSIKSQIYIEPKPGIPPTASHLENLIKYIKNNKIKLIWIENMFSDDVKAKINSQIKDVRIEKVPCYVGGAENINTSIDLIEYLVKSIEGVK